LLLNLKVNVVSFLPLNSLHVAKLSSPRKCVKR
jgi:hypothetical protein